MTGQRSVFIQLDVSFSRVEKLDTGEGKSAHGPQTQLV